MNTSLKIYCSSTGSLPQFEELGGHSYDETLILVPGNHLKKRYLQENIGDCLDFDEFVNKLLALNSETHPHEITGKAKVLTVDAIISSYPSQYFKPLCKKKGFINYIAGLFAHLGASGKSLEELKSVMLDKSIWDSVILNKNKEIMELYSGYLDKLQHNDWYDKEKKYNLLIEELTTKQDIVEFPYKKINIIGFDRYTNQQLEIIKLLSQNAEVIIYLDYDKERREDLFSPAEKIIATLGDNAEVIMCPSCSFVKSDLEFLAKNYGLFLEDDAKIKTEAIKLNSFVDSEEELRWTMAEIKAKLIEGVPFRDIAVYLGNTDYGDRIRAIADEYGIPVSIPRKTNLLSHPLANLMLKFIQCSNKVSITAADALFDLLTAVFLAAFNDDCGYDVNLLSDIHKEYYYTDIESISKLFEIYNDRAYGQKKIEDNLYVKNCLRQTGELRSKLDGEGRAPLNSFLADIEGFLRELDLQQKCGMLYAEGKLGLDDIRQIMTAERKLLVALEKIGTAYKACDMSDILLTAEEMQHVLLESFTNESIILAHGQDNGVIIAPGGEYTGKAYKYVYICGVREQEYPKNRREGWLYFDDECRTLKELGVDIPDRKSAFAIENLGFYRSCVSALEELNISWYREEGAKGDTDTDSGASSFANMVCSLFSDISCVPRSHYTDKVTDGHLHFASPEEVLALGVRAEESVRKLGTVDSRLYDIMKVDRLRTQDASYYNGNLGYRLKFRDSYYVPGKIAYASFRDTFTAKQLGLMGSCPFRFFVEVICGLKGIRNIYTGSDIDEEALLHRTIEEFFSMYKWQKLTAFELGELMNQLKGIFDRRCEQLESDRKVQTGDIWNLQKIRLWVSLYRMLEQLYDEDSQMEDYVVSLSPWSFGGTAKTVNVTLSDEYAPEIRGSIDLVLVNKNKNQNPAKLILNKFRLHDVSNENKFTFGEDQEMYAYILALYKSYGGKVNLAAASWYSFEEGKRTSNLPFDLDIADTLKTKGVFNFTTNNNKCRYAGKLEDKFAVVSEFAENILKNTIDSIRRSQFAPNTGYCNYNSCPYRAICRRDKAKKE